MKTSKVLKLAKKHLYHNTRMGICAAVSDAFYCDHVSSRDKQRVCALIDERLEPFAYATQWLAWQMVYPNKALPKSYYDMTYEQMQKIDVWSYKQRDVDIQAWRHEWLDQLIAEFAAKGD